MQLYLGYILLYLSSTLSSAQQRQRSNELPVECIADGARYRVGDTWKPKLAFSGTTPCIVCTCYKNGVVKCKKSSCPAVTCPNPIKDKKTCCMICPESTQFRQAEKSPRKKLSEVTKDTIDKYSTKETDSSSVTDSRAKGRPTTWRQRLIDFHESGKWSTPEATKSPPDSRDPDIQRLTSLTGGQKADTLGKDNWNPLAIKPQYPQNKLRLTLATGGLQNAPFKTTQSRRLGSHYGDMSKAFDLLKADPNTPDSETHVSGSMVDCHVQIMQGNPSPIQTYAHGDWWRSTLLIPGSSKCMECICVDGKVRCRVPKCTEVTSLPCKQPKTYVGKCCASCPVISTSFPPFSFNPDPPKQDKTPVRFEVKQEKTTVKPSSPAKSKISKGSCGGVYYPLLYRFMYENSGRPLDMVGTSGKFGPDKNLMSHVIAIRLRDTVEIYNWTLSEGDGPHRRHVIRMRASSFKRFNELSTPGGDFQLWSATSEARLRKFENREDKWNTSCKSRCESRLRRVVKQLLLKSPRRVKCALMNRDNDVN